MYENNHPIDLLNEILPLIDEVVGETKFLQHRRIVRAVDYGADILQLQMLGSIRDE